VDDGSHQNDSQPSKGHECSGDSAGSASLLESIWGLISCPLNAASQQLVLSVEAALKFLEHPLFVF
jgi:hypothetical protein